MEVDTGTMPLKDGARPKKHISLDRWISIGTALFTVAAFAVSYFVRDALSESQIQANKENVQINRQKIAALEDSVTRMQERLSALAREMDKVEGRLDYIERRKN